MDRLKYGMASSQYEEPPYQLSSTMPRVRTYHGTPANKTGTAASHNPHFLRSHHRLVSAMVNPGTNARAQALPRVKMANTATTPNAKPWPVCPVLANEAKHRVLTSIAKVTRCSGITRALDSCTNGDAKNRIALNAPAQRAIKRLPMK